MTARLICPTREVWWWHITFHKTRKVFPIQRTFNLLRCSWRGVLDTTLCDHVCRWLAAGRWFSPGTPISFTNKTDPHNIIESGVKRHNTNPLIWIARENTLYWTNIMTCKFHKPITRIKLHVLLLITMTNCFQWLHMGVKCPSIYTINGFLSETRNEKRNK